MVYFELEDAVRARHIIYGANAGRICSIDLVRTCESRALGLELRYPYVFGSLKVFNFFDYLGNVIRVRNRVTIALNKLT